MLALDLRARIGSLAIDVTLSVPAGTLALVGPNGAGKTTLLHLVLGIRTPDAGHITLGDRTLHDRAARIDVAPEERGFGYVPQHYALFPHLTSAGNVAFALACHGVPRAERDDRARALLHTMGVAHVADRLPTQLSGGEAQRVALARALATEPEALLLDEPLSALDHGTRRALRAWLAAELEALPRPAIIVTHDLTDAAALGQRIAVMEQGRIVQIGGLDELRDQPATPFVAELVARAHAPLAAEPEAR